MSVNDDLTEEQLRIGAEEALAKQEESQIDPMNIIENSTTINSYPMMSKAIWRLFCK